MNNPLTPVIVRTSTIAWITGRSGYASSMLGGYVAAPRAIVTIAMYEENLTGCPRCTNNQPIAK